MDKPKCTIISPCFNGEEYLENFLESLFIQTYTNVEFIFVNDGSTDKTEHIYYKYKTKLEDKGWTCKYIYQNNAGQAQAINTALKYVSGKYLIWPDSDDILYKNHIQEKIEFMEKNQEYGIAYCFIDDVYANNLDKIVHVRNIIPDNKGFKNILEQNENIMWPPIGVIIRMDALKDVLPNLTIYPSKGGQNCQIQLPILYKYKLGYIQKSLGKYVLHADSHSKISNKNFINRKYSLLSIWLHSIFSINGCPINKKYFYSLKVLMIFFHSLFRYLIQLTFSVKNEYTEIYKYKVITILGFKIKLNGKTSQTLVAVERERERERESNKPNGL